MQSEDPAKSATEARDSVRCNSDALRQCIDAAWSRLIHVGEPAGSTPAPPSDTRAGEQAEDAHTHRDTTSPGWW
jgi:hypothetical protein